tara:strand:+ start:194 stop:481 length:288 start_codon:yes stop_codon:yes gene_type:complete
MSETVTQEELKEAIELWAPKFNLIRELWPGASIEESLSLMGVIEDKAAELKEKKSHMGFISTQGDAAREKSKASRKAQASSPYNDGWTRQFYEKA